MHAEEQARNSSLIESLNKLKQAAKKKIVPVRALAGKNLVGCYSTAGYLSLDPLKNIMSFVTAARASRTGVARQALLRMHNTLNHRVKTLVLHGMNRINVYQSGVCMHMRTRPGAVTGEALRRGCSGLRELTDSSLQQQRLSFSRK